MSLQEFVQLKESDYGAIFGTAAALILVVALIRLGFGASRARVTVIRILRSPNAKKISSNIISKSKQAKADAKFYKRIADWNKKYPNDPIRVGVVKIK